MDLGFHAPDLDAAVVDIMGCLNDTESFFDAFVRHVTLNRYDGVDGVIAQAHGECRSLSTDAGQVAV